MVKDNYIIPLEIYPFDVMFSLNETNEELIESCKGTKIEGVIEDLLKETKNESYCTIFDSCGVLIKVCEKESFSYFMDILSHEIFHAVSLIMERIGMPLKVDISDEAYAYLTGYLTKQAMLGLETKGFKYKVPKNAN